MPHPLIFQSAFRTNTVVILDGLRAGDYQTAERLRDELEMAGIAGQSPRCEFYKIDSRATLFATLNDIALRCEAGLLPILHFEMHGGKNEGIELGDSQETASWAELHAHFQRINAITKNNLGLVMAACHGLYAMSSIRILQPAPFYFLIGCEEKVTAGLIDDQMKLFYREMFTTGLFDVAVKSVDPQFRHFHIERFFCTHFGRFVKKHYVGKGKRAHVERLISEKFAEGKIRNTAENRRIMREHFKALVRPSKFQFVQAANTFMHGRYSITYEKFIAFITQRPEGTIR